MKHLFLIFILSLTPAALSNAAAAENTPNVYEVEVMVFENRIPELEGGELWTPSRDKNVNAEMSDVVKIAENASAEATLAAAATALENSGRHHVLAHLTWRQNVEAKSASKPVQITGAAGELDGALRFYLSRFLFVDINLNLREAGAAGSEPGKEIPVYRLNEHRRVKIAEVHYFDHPKFGALVRVAPVKAVN